MRARLLLIAVAVTFAQGVAKPALASWTAGGAGTSGARAEVLAPPTGLTVTGHSCTPTYSGATPIGFRAGLIGASAVGSVTVSRPAGTATGDLLVAAYTLRDETANVITPPAGWTQVRLDSYTGNKMQTGVWYKVAASGDPASWTWTSSVTNVSGILAIAAYAGASAVDASSVGKQTSTSVLAPSVTPAVPGSRLLGVFSDVAGSSVSMSTPVTMTNRLQLSSGTTATLQVSDEGLFSTAATGARTATLGSSKDNIGQLIVLTPAVAPTASTISYQTGTTASGNASTVLTLPTGITTGDLLLVGYGKRKTTATIGTPGGWNLQAAFTQIAAQYQQGIYWRLATSADVAGTQYTWTSTSADTAALTLLVYRGVDQSAPIVTMGSQIDANTATITAPSQTPSRPDTRLVGIFGGQNNRTVSAGAAGMTTRQNITTALAGGGQEQLTIEAEDQRWPDANTPTGDRLVTMSGGTNAVGTLVALKAESYPLAALSWTASASSYADGYRLGRSVGGTETVVTQLGLVTSYTVGNTNHLTAGTVYDMAVKTKANLWRSTATTASFTAITTC